MKDDAACPLVSVIVPAYNAAHTIEETLASVERQLYPHVEILIVNDGSNDATPRIAAAFCARNDHARLISKPNGGVAAARNAGIAAARGTYVAPIDADDLWHPQYLAKLVEKAVGTRPRPGLIFSSYRPIDGASHIIGCGSAISVDGPAARRMALRNFVGNGSSIMVDRAAALAAGGYDTRLRDAGAEGCEDYLLQMIIASRHPIASVPEFLVGYRRLPEAMSADHERMFVSGTLAKSLFAAAAPGLRIPGWVARWSQARRLLALARQRVYCAKRLGAARLFAEALWLDPVIVAATGTDRAARLVGKCLRHGAPRRPISFHHADPTAADLAGVPGPRRSGWLVRLEEARWRRIEEMDQSLPFAVGPRKSRAAAAIPASSRQRAG